MLLKLHGGIAIKRNGIHIRQNIGVTIQSKQNSNTLNIVKKNHETIRLSAQIYKREHKVEVLIATRKRQAAQLRAIPVWALEEWDSFVVAEMYHLSALRTELTGIKWHVDHTIPLQNKLVCGLHCAANLAVIPAQLNYQKNNKYWPDMP